MKTQEQLEKIRKQMDSYIQYFWYTDKNILSPVYGINNYGTVDIYLSVTLKLPYHVKKLPFKINSAQGDFKIRSTQLTTLEGMPRRIEGNFEMCFNQKITSLAFCPQIIEGDFDCLLQNITSLQNAPAFVAGNVSIYAKPGLIVDYNGIISGDLYLSSNGVNIINMPTVEGNVKMSDPDYLSKIRKSVLNGIIN